MSPRSEVYRLAKSRGWEVENTRRHLLLVHPSGARVVASASPSCRRYLRNVEGDMKRAERRAAGGVMISHFHALRLKVVPCVKRNWEKTAIERGSGHER
jgi:hypothetical protein